MIPNKPQINGIEDLAITQKGNAFLFKARRNGQVLGTATVTELDGGSSHVSEVSYNGLKGMFPKDKAVEAVIRMVLGYHQRQLYS